MALDRDGPQGGRPATNLSAVPVKTEAKILSLSRSETPSYQLHACFEKFVAIMESLTYRTCSEKGMLNKALIGELCKNLKRIFAGFSSSG